MNSNKNLLWYVEAYHGKPVREVLRQTYIVEDKTIKATAKELHLSQQLVAKLLKQYKLKKDVDLL